MTTLDYSKVTELEFDGIDHKDYPDYCDAYITDGLYDGRKMSDDQLDEINDDRDFVYEKVWDYLH